MKKYFLLFLIPVFTLTSCYVSDSSTSKSLTVLTDQEIYKSDQQVEVLIKNNTGSSVLFSPCGTFLERHQNESWTAVDTIICTANIREPISIKPGEYFIQKLPWFNDGHEEGEYRFVFLLSKSSGDLLPLEKRTTGLLTVTN